MQPNKKIIFTDDAAHLTMCNLMYALGSSFSFIIGGYKFNVKWK